MWGVSSPNSGIRPRPFSIRALRGALYRFGKTLNDVSVQKHFDKEEGRRR